MSSASAATQDLALMSSAATQTSTHAKVAANDNASATPHVARRHPNLHPREGGGKRQRIRHPSCRTPPPKPPPTPRWRQTTTHPPPLMSYAATQTSTHAKVAANDNASATPHVVRRHPEPPPTRRWRQTTRRMSYAATQTPTHVVGVRHHAPDRGRSGAWRSTVSEPRWPSPPRERRAAGTCRGRPPSWPRRSGPPPTAPARAGRGRWCRSTGPPGAWRPSCRRSW